MESHFNMSLGPDALDLTLPFMHYMSPGPENHLTKAYWNSSSRQLMSGCTVYGDTVTPQMIGVFPPFKAVQGPNCTRVKLQPGAVSEWTEVGSNFDTLMFGTWEIPRLKHCATSPGAGAIGAETASEGGHHAPHLKKASAQSHP